MVSVGSTVEINTHATPLQAGGDTTLRKQCLRSIRFGSSRVSWLRLRASTLGRLSTSTGRRTLTRTTTPRLCRTPTSGPRVRSSLRSSVCSPRTKLADHSRLTARTGGCLLGCVECRSEPGDGGAA